MAKVKKDESVELQAYNYPTVLNGVTIMASSQEDADKQIQSILNSEKSE